jgi:hypothetical protein
MINMQPVLSLDVAILDKSMLDVILVARSGVLPHRVHSIDGFHEVSINVVHFSYGSNCLAFFRCCTNLLNLLDLR